MSSSFSLAQLGWRPLHSQQLTLQDLEAGYPARIMNLHRSGLVALSERGTVNVSLPHRIAESRSAPITVGDWVLLENDAPRILRLIEPHSIITRLVAGTDRRLQSIAANIDTLFLVTSCNQDFSPSRLERYLALAHEARVEPVILLTKVDLCDETARFLDTARTLAAVAILEVNATDSISVGALLPWLQAGQTVAFVGSSGVGKSTLVNTLIGVDAQMTSGIREDDAKGRHTTTSREMFGLQSGAWVIDTPGMRELKVGEVQAGLRAVFDDVETLATQCRFRDCTHGGNAGCALSTAVDEGRLEPRRLASYLKLRKEAQNAAMTNSERRARDRKFGRMQHSSMKTRKQPAD